MKKVMYSLLEQHNDGSWWYHPGNTYNSPEEAEEAFKKIFWWDLDRPHKVIKHTGPLFQEHSSCTKDFNTFEFAGLTVCTLTLSSNTDKERE